MFLGDNSIGLMDMKAILTGLMFVICAQLTEAQVIRVPVGASYFVSKKSYSVSHTAYCRNTSQVCIYNLNTSVYETPNHGFNGRSQSGPHPDHNYPYSFYYSDNLEFYFTSDTLSSFKDTVRYDYSLYNVKNDCGARCPSNESMSVIEQYNFVSYYDSLVRVNNYGKDTITFNHYIVAYDEKMHHLFGLFNNLFDTLYCDSISFVVDSSVSIKMNLLPDAITYTDFLVLPYERIIPKLFFSTNAGLFADTTFIHGAIKVHATSRGDDTVIIIPLVFRFTPKEKSIVTTKNSTNVNSLKVINPITHGRLHLFANLNHNIDAIIECYDILGVRLYSLHDGFLEAGEHEFSAELPTGMYYVRMQAGDEVLTRKVAVVR